MRQLVNKCKRYSFLSLFCQKKQSFLLLWKSVKFSYSALYSKPHRETEGVGLRNKQSN